MTQHDVAIIDEWEAVVTFVSAIDRSAFDGSKCLIANHNPSVKNDHCCSSFTHQRPLNVYMDKYTVKTDWPHPCRCRHFVWLCHSASVVPWTYWQSGLAAELNLDQMWHVPLSAPETPARASVSSGRAAYRRWHIPVCLSLPLCCCL